MTFNEIAETFGGVSVDGQLNECGLVCDGGMTITYFTAHGQEKELEVEPCERLADFLSREHECFDPCEEAMLWLGKDGHGKNGAPYDMGDVLADEREWKAKLMQLATFALRAEKEAAK